MSNPVKTIFDECRIGFIIGRKIKLTLIGIAYVLSPLDVLPDPFIPVGLVDDLVVIYLVVKVWRSPTIVPSSASGDWSEADITDVPPIDSIPVRNTEQRATR